MFPWSLGGERSILLLRGRRDSGQRKMGWSEISFDDKVRENSEMGFYSSFTSPPTSLYLYLKQVHARTKNSSLFLTTVCLVCGFFEGIVETRNTGSNVQDIRWR